MNFPRPRLRVTFLLFSALLCLAWQPRAMAQMGQDRTIDSARTVLDEVMAIPAQQIPQSLLANAAGVAIFPNVVKGGFVIGVRLGRGVILVRDDKGQWHPPMFATLKGGSVGWQAGLQSTDVVLVFRSRRSLKGLMNGKLTIGADAAAAAGPVGREAAAATDGRLGAELFSYSRSRGLFAGVSIDGSVLQLDHVAGAGYYRQPIIAANGEAVAPLDTVPTSAIRLMNQLAHYTGSPQIVPAEQTPAQPPNAVTSAVPPSAALRRQLATSWQQLSVLLDDRWKAYLEPPREALVPGPAPPLERLREKIQHYEGINQDPRFAILNKAPEFAAAYQALQEYTTAVAPQASTKLVLPPPPTLGTGRPNARY